MACVLTYLGSIVTYIFPVKSEEVGFESPVPWDVVQCPYHGKSTFLEVSPGVRRALAPSGRNYCSKESSEIPSLIHAPGTDGATVVFFRAINSQQFGGGQSIQGLLDKLSQTAPDHLKCPICNKIMSDAVILPCCHKSTCDSCVRRALASSGNMSCPLCKTRGIGPDSLLPNV